MKKYFVILVCTIVLLSVSGCGKNNQLKCSKTETEDGITMAVDFVLDFDKNDKVTDSTITYDLGDSSTAEMFCSIMKASVDSSNGESVTCSGSKITIKGLDNFDADEDSDSEKLIGKTRDEVIAAAKEDGFTCK